MRPAPVLALALAIGCAHVPAHQPGDEQLKAIKFEGNHQLSDKTLVTGLALHRTERRGGAPDPYLISIDADRIRGEYLRKGFLDVDVRSRVERRGDAATVTYTVEEGPRAGTRVVITGLPADVPVDAVRAKLPLRDGQPFEYETYDLAKPLLLGVVQDAGYARAQLDARVIADRADHAAVVDLAYTPGPKCRFGNVEIAGASGELATAVRERLAFEPGQAYSTQAITQTQRNLYGFGRFSTVQVQPDQAGGEVVNVKVAVAESARHQVLLGGGLGRDTVGYSVHGRAGYSITGWPFPLDTASIEVRPEYVYNTEPGTANEPRLRALARLERADLFWTYTKASIDAGYNYLTWEAYTSYGPLARLGFETPILTPRVKLRVGWRIEQNGFRNITSLIRPPSNVDPQDPASQQAAADRRVLESHLGLNNTSERVGGYEQALIVDLRDKPIEPRLGGYGELRTTEGTALAGGTFDYFEAIGDVRGFAPLPAGIVLAGRARYGGIWGNIPVTERLFSGGAVSQRGFGERRLAPSARGQEFVTVTLDNMTKVSRLGGPVIEIPYGGGGLFETSLEARVPITTIREMPVGIVAFVDGADVTETPGQIDPGNLYWAVGGGLRLLTAVGPVRFDVGYRVSRTDPMDPRNLDPKQHFAYHLTIGEAF